jgi:hypothetical protein
MRVIAAPLLRVETGEIPCRTVPRVPLTGRSFFEPNLLGMRCERLLMDNHISHSVDGYRYMLLDYYAYLGGMKKMSNHRAIAVCILSCVFCCMISVVALGHHDDPCTKVAVQCPGWGATDPEVPGFCCVQQDPGAAPCSEGQIKGAKPAGAGCGKLKEIDGGNCTSIGNEFCGIQGGRLGCDTGACSG